MKYSERLRTARKHKNLSQDALSILSGVGQGTISKIERGDQESSTFDIELAEALDISPLWLKTGDKKNTPKWLNSGDQVNESNSELANTEPNLIIHPITFYFPIVPWHKLSLFLNSTVNIEEFETMPSTKKYNKDAFYLRAEDDLYAPYLKSGELALVQPSNDTLGKRVIVEMNDNFYVMDHCILEQECFLPKREGARQIDITDNLNYRIHGVIEEIITIRKG
jgi:transcriptional regulator with XRE-family HTH domain